MVVLTAAGWAYLLLVAMQQAPAGTSGLLDAMCRPLPRRSADRRGSLRSSAPMWVAMTLAMMLPTAGPMILTYAEIADTAARKGERIVSPLVLIAGYLAVWFGFARSRRRPQVAIDVADGLGRAQRPSLCRRAVLFLAAGLYQFSALKQACLRVCQRPFPFFFANWTDEPAACSGSGCGRGCIASAAAGR